jgi:hypothetical protein
MKTYEVKNSLLAKMLGFNITLYPFIFYIGEPTKRTIKHESIHVEQIRRHGVLRFYVSYLLHYFAYRIAGNSSLASYLLIPYEIEAYSRETED